MFLFWFNIINIIFHRVFGILNEKHEHNESKHENSKNNNSKKRRIVTPDFLANAVMKSFNKE